MFLGTDNGAGFQPWREEPGHLLIQREQTLLLADKVNTYLAFWRPQQVTYCILQELEYFD